MSKIIFEVQVKTAAQQGWKTNSQFFRQENAEACYDELRTSRQYAAVRICITQEVRSWELRA